MELLKTLKKSKCLLNCVWIFTGVCQSFCPHGEGWVSLVTGPFWGGAEVGVSGPRGRHLGGKYQVGRYRGRGIPTPPVPTSSGSHQNRYG